MAKTSPTQRSLRYLRENGYEAQVVERWNQFAGIRQDLFGCIDIVAVGNGEILGVQATSASNLSARRTKSEPLAKGWLANGGQFELHGWSKKGPRGKQKLWTLTRERWGVPID